MTTLRVHIGPAPIDLEMVNDISEIPLFADAEAERAFWASHWASPRLIDQLQQRAEMIAEIGRD